ncbi:MAG: hypothetical protein DDT23_01332 [candidate division WS2 bacterium]|nr:hypothetical protein [Candidatus Lithacetigena glycinireducens]
MRTELEPQDIENIIKEALSKYDKGRFNYGDLELTTDKRDFIYEAEQELLDCINYCIFQILKLRGIK